MNQEKVKRTKRLEGIVIQNKMDKTVVVLVERSFKHPSLLRIVKRSKKYYAHDKDNACGIGDVVQIAETRPLSRLKRWRIEKILRKSLQQFDESESGVMQ
jgi:small subunit ribosomal protein S17